MDIVLFFKALHLLFANFIIADITSGLKMDFRRICAFPCCGC